MNCGWNFTAGALTDIGVGTREDSGLALFSTLPFAPLHPEVSPPYPPGHSDRHASFVDDGLPTLSIADALAGEGTADGSDYVGRTDTLTFLPGMTTQAVSFQVKPDTMVEPIYETFFVRLSSPTNATSADGEAEGTIVDNDDLDVDADPFLDPFYPFGS